jgi:hypothetical protein
MKHIVFAHLLVKKYLGYSQHVEVVACYGRLWIGCPRPTSVVTIASNKKMKTVAGDLKLQGNWNSSPSYLKLYSKGRRQNVHLQRYFGEVVSRCGKGTT